MSRPIRSIQKQLRTRFWIDQIDRFEIIQFVNHDQTKNCGKIAAMRGRIAVMQTTIRWLWRDPFVELDLGASFEPLANNGMVGGGGWRAKWFANWRNGRLIAISYRRFDARSPSYLDTFSPISFHRTTTFFPRKRRQRFPARRNRKLCNR